mgnify:CR=1 FL=1|jgi:hypothetical protein
MVAMPRRINSYQQRAFGRVFCWVAAKLEVIAEDIGSDNIASH